MKSYIKMKENKNEKKGKSAEKTKMCVNKRNMLSIFK